MGIYEVKETIKSKKLCAKAEAESAILKNPLKFIVINKMTVEC